MLKSNLFPLKEDVRSTDIPRWLAACEKAGLLRCYEVDSKRFLEIPRFGQRTRAEASKFPQPPVNGGHLPDICPTSAGPMRTYSESESYSESSKRSAPNAEAETPPQPTGELPLADTEPEDPIILVYPTVGNPAYWQLRQSKITEYEATFPGVPVLSALREARQWCVDNERRRKTPRGMPQFLFGWLERRQNRPGNARTETAPLFPQGTHHSTASTPTNLR